MYLITNHIKCYYYLPFSVICQCKYGYAGSGTSCVEINRCLEIDRGGCHQQVK